MVGSAGEWNCQGDGVGVSGSNLKADTRAISTYMSKHMTTRRRGVRSWMEVHGRTDEENRYVCVPRWTGKRSTKDAPKTSLDIQAMATKCLKSDCSEVFNINDDMG